MSYWRRQSEHCLWDALSKIGIGFYDDLSNATAEEKRKVKRALMEAYPFGERTNHPYKIWCEERRKVLLQIGMEKAKPKKESTPLGVQLGIFDTVRQECKTDV